jgi:hypothetical protein
MKERRPRFISVLVLALALGFTASEARAQGRSDCVTSDVHEAFTLPDGSTHPAGRLTLCTVLSLNPVTGVHRVWIDGHGASFVLTRRVLAEAGPDTEPAFLFRRVPGAPLDLIGFVVSDGHRTWTYSLRREAARFSAGSGVAAAAPLAGASIDPH